MILKDELPDLIVATDKNVINQLIRSGKVWSLQDFFETYCPDSHLLKDFPKPKGTPLLCFLPYILFLLTLWGFLQCCDLS